MKTSQINNLYSIKNATALNTNSIFLINNNKTLRIVHFLYKEGLIQSYSCTKYKICLFLRYLNTIPVFKYLKLVSKPSQKKFLTYRNICRISKPNKILLFSTDTGLYNQSDCIKNLKGGKLLFIV